MSDEAAYRATRITGWALVVVPLVVWGMSVLGNEWVVLTTWLSRSSQPVQIALYVTTLVIAIRAMAPRDGVITRAPGRRRALVAAWIHIAAVQLANLLAIVVWIARRNGGHVGPIRIPNVSDVASDMNLAAGLLGLIGASAGIWLIAEWRVAAAIVPRSRVDAIASRSGVDVTATGSRGGAIAPSTAWSPGRRAATIAGLALIIAPVVALILRVLNMGWHLVYLISDVIVPAVAIGAYVVGAVVAATALLSPTGVFATGPGRTPALVALWGCVGLLLVAPFLVLDSMDDDGPYLGPFRMDLSAVASIDDLPVSAFVALAALLFWVWFVIEWLVARRRVA